jgi:hypothetical protein
MVHSLLDALQSALCYKKLDIGVGWKCEKSESNYKGKLITGY